ncbi:CLUMA_CG010364, isoform A [Clunio marinus]|uniref:CLUMA_CG010364, isoform A n=1 Tax=Clunio marinus TaxID=568069 RepID=A0A1J1IDC0_9DIPT|nr:CLUMA_CG010364, isoform A [Clunio marinus]
MNESNIYQNILNKKKGLENYSSEKIEIYAMLRFRLHKSVKILKVISERHLVRQKDGENRQFPLNTTAISGVEEAVWDSCTSVMIPCDIYFGVVQESKC